MGQAFLWLGLNLLTIMMLAFYSMIEMACVSVNKARIQFYAMNGSWRAQMLQALLSSPSWLFSTTLIGVNVATIVGSECAREFHASIGINPDFAPISQVILVLILGELAPMFAARMYSEHVALLGAPLLYLSAKILTPITWSISFLTGLIDKWMGGAATSHEMFLGKDELIKMVEGQDAPSENIDNQELTNITSSLFTLHTQHAADLMEPLTKLDMLPSDATITQLRNLLRRNPQTYTPIYHRRPTNIIGILHARDVLRAQVNHRVSEYSQAPWFVTTKTNIASIIQQFRRNNQRLAIIIDNAGKAVGFLSFAAIITEVFGETPSEPTLLKPKKSVALLHEKTLSAQMTVEEFKIRFGIILDKDDNLTLAELLYRELGHHPNVGDMIIMGNYKITVKEMSLLDIKTVTISSLA